MNPNNPEDFARAWHKLDPGDDLVKQVEDLEKVTGIISGNKVERDGESTQEAQPE